jgi:hypothetical protein
VSAKPAGWGWPLLSKKAHYFYDGRSLCGKWLFSGALTANDAHTVDDCADCTKRRAAMLKRQQTKAAAS